MGRICNWIDRIAGRRADAPLRDVHRARRRLTFERCEPRLTLSAASPAAIDESPTDTLILFDVVKMQTGGLQAFDSVGWEQAQPPSQRMTFDFRDSLRAGLSAQGGGLVDLNALPLNSVATGGTSTWSYLDTRQSIVQAAFEDNALSWQVGTPTLSSSSPLATLEMAFADLNSQPGLLPDWNTFVPDRFDDGLPAQGPAGLFGDGGELESEMIRIDAPQIEQDSEGGTIELTAMLGPQPTLSTPPPLRLAATSGLGSQVAATISSTDMSKRQSTPTDGPRARAVVVNVALVHESAGIDDSASWAPRSTDPSSAEQSPTAARDAARHATRDARGRYGRDLDVEAARAPQQAVEAAAEQAAPAAAAKASQPKDGETAAVRRDAHDAALGEWTTAPVERDADAAASVAASHDRRFLGAAVALAAGAGPVVRRVRRARGTTPVEDAAGVR